MFNFDSLDYMRRFGSFIMLLVGFVFIFASGLFFGFTYYVLDVTDDALRTTDCVIENNTLVSSCQGLFELGVYPFLALKELLIWLSWVFIFALVLGMLLVGYQAGKSTVYLGVNVVFTVGLTYLGIEMSNIYRGLLDNAIFRAMMLDFTVYNKVMLYFPWFVFFVGLFSLMLGIVNYQKSKVNTPTEVLDY